MKIGNDDLFIVQFVFFAWTILTVVFFSIFGEKEGFKPVLQFTMVYLLPVWFPFWLFYQLIQLRINRNS